MPPCRLVGAIVAIALVASCSAPAANTSTQSAPPGTPTAVATPAPTTVANSTPDSSPRPRCPSVHGGRCLGPLTAGTYDTIVFKPGLAYTVPEGWANYEDLPGNVLLIPPGGSNDGVDAGTSDYIGIYQDVAVADASCKASREPGVDGSPAAMTDALGSRPGLDVSDPLPVQVGGLAGLMIDVALASGWTGGCPDMADTAIVPLTISAGLADIEHAQFAGFTTRLYILEFGATNIVIEISDVATSPGAISDYEPVVASLKFGS